MSHPYTLLGKLGQGGMGEVHKALHRDLERVVALKVIRPDSLDRETVLRFRREVEACIALAHPNVIRILDFGELPDGNLYYTMPLLEARTLESLTDAGALPVPRALRLLRQAADALAHLHERRMIHRDLKPMNVMVDAADHLTVMDFGLVKLVDRSLLTEEGARLGTPRYLAPEVIAQSIESPAQDVYAVGLTFWQLLAGRKAAGNRDRMQILEWVLRIGPEPLAQAAPDTPAWLAELIDRMVHPEPRKRPSAAEVRERVARRGDGARSAGVRRPVERVGAASGPEAASGAASQAPGSRRAGRAARRRRTGLAVGVALGLVLGGLGGAAVARRRAAERAAADVLRGSAHAVAPSALATVPAAGAAHASSSPGAPTFAAARDGLVPIEGFKLWPLFGGARVDFHDPAGRPLRIEVHAREEPGRAPAEAPGAPTPTGPVVRQVDVVPAGPSARARIDGLEPDREYRMWIRDGARAVLAGYPFRTLSRRPAEARAELAKWLARKNSTLDIGAGALTDGDPGEIAMILDAVRAPGHEFWKDPRTATIVLLTFEENRAVEAAEFLVAVLARPMVGRAHPHAARALSACRDPRALPHARRFLDRLDSDGSLEEGDVVTIASRFHGPEPFALLAALRHRLRPGRARDFARRMVAVDPAAAARLAGETFVRADPNDDELRFAIALAHGLDAPDLVGASLPHFARRAGTLAAPIALLIADRGGTAARAALRRRLDGARRTDEAAGDRLTLAVALGMAAGACRAPQALDTGEAESILRLLPAERSVADRVAGAVALGLAVRDCPQDKLPPRHSPAVAAALRRSLTDPDPPAAAAAAWALGRAPASDDVDALVNRAADERDAGGHAALALFETPLAPAPVARLVFAAERVRAQLGEGAPPPALLHRAVALAILLARKGQRAGLALARAILARPASGRSSAHHAAAQLVRDIEHPPAGVRVLWIDPTAPVHRTGIVLDATRAIELRASGYWGFTPEDAVSPVGAVVTDARGQSLQLLARVGDHEAAINTVFAPLGPGLTGELVLSTRSSLDGRSAGFVARTPTLLWGVARVEIRS